MIGHRKIFAIGLLSGVIFFANQSAYSVRTACVSGLVSTGTEVFQFNGYQPANAGCSDKFYRTELYFGMDKPKGGEVTEDEWNKFLEAEITPRFPDGLTVLEGYGQFKDSLGKIERENSRVLILLYTKQKRAETHKKIEEIRNAYKKQFEQESVLRLDFPKAVQVSF